MASILSRNSLPNPSMNNQMFGGMTNPVQQTPTAQGSDPLAQINAAINQILGSQDPAAAFQQILKSSPEAQNAMNIIYQYGNGNPETAFANYAAASGRQAIAQPILQKLGLVK